MLARLPNRCRADLLPILLGQMGEQAAVFEQLQEDVGALQQIVEGLEVLRADAVGMRQIQAAVFLRVEALVFNLPSVASSLLGNGCDVVCA